MHNVHMAFRLHERLIKFEDWNSNKRVTVLMFNKKIM